MSVGQQRALGTVDAICWHQQVLQRPVAIFEYHIARIRLHLRAGCRVTVLQLIRQTLVEDDMAQRIRITRFYPVHAASGKGDDNEDQ